MRKLVLPLIFLLVFLVQSSLAQNSDKDTLIKAAQVLEADPFNSKADDFRKWAMTYIIKTDDVSILVCTSAITPLIEKKYKYANEMLAQYSIGMAAFKLTNPGNKDDSSAQVAGIESAIKAYQSMVKAKPKAQYPAIDDLIAKRDKGELRTFVEGAKCGEGKTAPIN